jgi:hypothetical protein
MRNKRSVMSEKKREDIRYDDDDDDDTCVVLVNMSGRRDSARSKGRGGVM